MHYTIKCNECGNVICIDIDYKECHNMGCLIHKFLDIHKEKYPDCDLNVDRPRSLVLHSSGPDMWVISNNYSYREDN